MRILSNDGIARCYERIGIVAHRRGLSCGTVYALKIGEEFPNVFLEAINEETHFAVETVGRISTIRLFCHAALACGIGRGKSMPNPTPRLSVCERELS